MHLKDIGADGQRGVRALLVVLAISAVVGVNSGVAHAGANPGNPNGGPPSATAGADPEGGDITALVQGGRSAARGGHGGSSCRWFRGDMGLHNEGYSKAGPGGGFALVDSESGRIVVALYGRLCDGETDPTWVFVETPTDRQVAEIALDQVRRRLPKPQAAFVPDVEEPSTPAVVHFPLWFAVPESQWGPVSATASVLGVSATVTATPTRLTFHAGDGGRAVSCAGPGPTWRVGMIEPARQPACSYVYRDVSTLAPNGHAWTSQLQILWRVTWTATNGAPGSLGTLTTANGFAIPVVEQQSVETAIAGRER